MSIATRVMNDEALRTAIRAVVPAQAQIIEELYVLLDDAQRKGYDQGTADANEYRDGQDEIERDNAWDAGFLSGVEKSRRVPAEADRIVQDIIADMSAYALNGEFEAEYPAEFEQATTGDAKFNAHVEGADWDLDNKGYTEAPVEWTEAQPYPTYEG